MLKLKKTLLFITLHFIAILSCAQTTFDNFFSNHPLDIHFGSHIHNFTIITDKDEKKEGYTANLAAGVGWRYQLIANKYFSIGPRIALSGGYMENKGNSNLTIHTPVTLNVVIGAGSHKNNDSKYGVTFGGGYAANLHTLQKFIEKKEYQKTVGYSSPVVYTSFNFVHDKSIFGIMPFYSWFKEHQFIGIQIIGYLIHK